MSCQFIPHQHEWMSCTPQAMQYPSCPSSYGDQCAQQNLFMGSTTPHMITYSPQDSLTGHPMGHQIPHLSSFPMGLQMLILKVMYPSSTFTYDNMCYYNYLMQFHTL